MKGMVMIGATSAIAQAVARKLTNPEARFMLVGRNKARLDAIAADLETRGAAEVSSMVLDLCDVCRHEEIIEKAKTKLGDIDLVLIAHGTLPEQRQLERSHQATLQCLQENALSVISLATLFGNYFRELGRGTLVAISSVAGERGRQSNYVYGTAKAAVSTFMQGLRNRLQPAGVHVLTVKPGLVETPMTAQFDKGPLWVTPDVVANDIVRGIKNRRDVIYTPFFWRYIMLIIRIIPETIFKRMKL
jgi:short-subunit dehydrogenase